MKIIDIKRKAGKGEYVFGAEDTGSRACYMIYGCLRPGEKGRLVRPGGGHEELLLAVKGDIKVSGHFSGTLKEGSAFHISGEEECFLENDSDMEVIYVIAGGHSDGGHEH